MGADDIPDGRKIIPPVDLRDPDAQSILFQRQLLRDWRSVFHPKKEFGRNFGVYNEYPNEPLFWSNDHQRKLSRHELFDHHARILMIVNEVESKRKQ